MQNYRNKILIGIITITMLVAVYFIGNTDNISDEVYQTPLPSVSVSPIPEENTEKNAEENIQTFSPEKTEQISVSENSPIPVLPKNDTTPTPEENFPSPVTYSAQSTEDAVFETSDSINNTTPEKEKTTCILSVNCSTIFSNIEKFPSEKLSLLPSDGYIFPEKNVDFHNGDSVFLILKREMKRNKIHMEFINTPVYKSAYIEGIGNIYEFDCGELSGWIYKVNEIFPNCSASKYFPNAGDKIEWVYTCDLGADVGGREAAAGGQKDE